MTKFPEAEARLFHNVFVCRKCKTRIKTTSIKVKAETVKCKKCNYKSLRPVRKK